MSGRWLASAQITTSIAAASKLAEVYGKKGLPCEAYHALLDEKSGEMKLVDVDTQQEVLSTRSPDAFMGGLGLFRDSAMIVWVGWAMAQPERPGTLKLDPPIVGEPFIYIYKDTGAEDGSEEEGDVQERSDDGKVP